MTVVYIDSKNLLKLFEEAVADLEKGLVTKPYALTQVLDSIGTVTGDPVFFTLPTAIGPFIVEVMQCRQVAASPMLLDETRKRLNKILKECLEEGSKQIKTIGEQVTTNPYDSKALLEEVGLSTNRPQ